MSDGNLASGSPDHLSAKRLESPSALNVVREETPQRKKISSQSMASSSRNTATPLSNTAPQLLMSPIVPSTGEPGIVPIVQNIVSTVNLSCPLDLMKINCCTRNSEYNPQRFSGIVMRIREPQTTALIFQSGKMVVTGARCEDDSSLAARKFARIIQKLGFNIKFRDFKMQNMIATCDLRFPIRLENLNQMHGQFSSYEPELFPGLVYRMVRPRVVLLIFVNGKIVFTGAKTRQDLQESLDNIYPILKSFKKR